MRNIMKKSLLALGAFVLTYGWIVHSSVLAVNGPARLYDQVWKIIDTRYVDKTDNHQAWESKWRHKYDNYIQTDEDAYVAINTMLASLNDPYTRFLEPKEFRDEKASMDGALKGIGIQIGMKDGKLTVIAPIEDTPAERAGLLAGDVILEINGQSTKSITVDKAAEQIRGPENTTVNLLIKRDGVDAPKLYTVTRATIKLKAVSQKLPESITLPNDMCYIRLSSFMSQNAASEFRSIIERNYNKKGFIIDLRSNPGGRLVHAITISDMFLSKGEDIVSTVDRNNYIMTDHATTGVLTKKPIVILINKGSASASEIFSGAMKDNGKAVLVGETTFGKGLVQEVIPLGKEISAHVTIQRYLTPSGTDIHKRGIAPDVEVKLTEENIKNKDDVQLKTAIDVLQKMIRGASVASFSKRYF